MGIKDSLYKSPLPQTVQDAIRTIERKYNHNGAYVVFHRHWVDREPYYAIAESMHYTEGTCRNYASRMMKEVEREMEGLI